MNDKNEEHISSAQVLANYMTLQEILEQAIEFERTVRDFYADLIPKVGKNLRYLLEDLVLEEQQHYELFSNLLNDPDVAEHIDKKITIPANNQYFSDCIQVTDLGDKPDDQMILQYALGREQAAMDQYNALAKTAPEGVLRDAFTFLAQEETQHKKDLEKIYYDVVHSGGV